MYLDISKAFDRVWHEGLIFKLRRCGISGQLLSMIQNFLADRKQRTVFNGKASDWGKSLLVFLKALFSKSRKQEHSKIRTCRLILWKKTPKDKNQKQTDLHQCSYEMVHLLKRSSHFII